MECFVFFLNGDEPAVHLSDLQTESAEEIPEAMHR